MRFCSSTAFWSPATTNVSGGVSLWASRLVALSVFSPNYTPFCLLELGGPGPGIGGASGDLAVARCEPGTSRRPFLHRHRSGYLPVCVVARVVDGGDLLAVAQTLAVKAPCFEDVERIKHVERRRVRDVHERHQGVKARWSHGCSRTGACNTATITAAKRTAARPGEQVWSKVAALDVATQPRARRAHKCISLAASRMPTPHAALVATLSWIAFAVHA
eukprot:scaffold49044_cov73-Phaeocystis_antarctica.AAC.1